MDPNTKSALDAFGRQLIQIAYDHTCWYLEHVFIGHMRGPRARSLADQYNSLDDHSKQVVRLFAMEGVNQTIAEILNLFDEREIGIAFTTSTGETVNIQKISDGLTGELYTEDGWIARFSKYKDGLKAAPDPQPE